MINAILKGIFKLVISLVNLLLTPIDTLIQSALPDLAAGISAVGSFLSLCMQSIGWVLSVFAIPTACISLLILYYGFKLTVPLIISTVKLAIRWYDKLKP